MPLDASQIDPGSGAGGRGHPLADMLDLLPKAAAIRDGDALRVNQATCDLTGFPPEAIATVDDWFRSLYGERHLAMRLIYERHRRSGDAVSTVMPLNRVDGSAIYVEFALARHNRIEVWLLSDVTERVTSDERFRLLFELTADAHFLFDDAGVVDCNRAAVEITGRGTKARLLGIQLADLMVPDSCCCEDGIEGSDPGRDGFQAMTELARANGHHRCDACLRTADGAEIPVEVTLTSVRQGGRALMLAALHDLSERKKAADALRASEERFRQIAEAAGEYIWEIDADGRYRFVSDRIADVLGRPVNEIIGRSLFDFVADSDRTLLQQWFAETKQSHLPFRDIELRGTKPNGSAVRRRESGQPIIDQDGALLGFRGVGQDTTRLHAAERDRARTEARFRELIEGSIQGILIHRKFKPLFANQTFADMYGFESVDAVLAETDIFPLICGTDEGGYEQAWQRQLSGTDADDYPARQEVRKLSGEKIWINSMVRPIEWMGEPAIQITTLDATQKHLAEENVQRVERHLRDAVESINEGFALWDADDRLVLCNERFRRLLPAFEDAAVSGAAFGDLAELMSQGETGMTDVAGPDWLTTRKATLERDRLLRSEFRVDNRWYLISERRTADDGIVSVYSDIDTLKRNEEKLQHNEDILNHYISDLEDSRTRVEEQSQRLAELAEMYASERAKADAANEAKSQFLATMSHELRTPMTGVMGMIDLLQRTSLSTEQDRYVDTLRQSADSLLTLLNDILDFSKIEAGRLTIEQTDFDLRGLCGEVAALFRERADDRNTAVRVRVAPDVPEIVLGDPTRLRQILNNLVSNAVKFTENGFVEIRAELDEIQPHEGVFLRFEVEDTGIGLSPDEIDRLFNAFVQADTSTTRKYGGTGLGLAISRRLVEAMQGKIGVESQPGRGSVFWFTMIALEQGDAPTVHNPAGGADSAAASVSDPVMPAPGSQVRVLLAEDNAVNQMLIVSMLTGMGYQVDAVDNGREAVEHVARDPGFDMILMDMQMPEMDGPSATKAIREMPGRGNSIPIVALTANASPEHRRGYLDAGLDDVLTKPIEWKRLDAAIRALAIPADSDRPAEDTKNGASAGTHPNARQVALFDIDALRQLEAALGPDSLREMVDLMLITARQSLAELRQFSAAGNMAALAEASHCLKGVAANFCATHITHLAAKLQDVDTLAEPVDDVLAALAEAIVDTEAAIGATLAGLVSEGD